MSALEQRVMVLCCPGLSAPERFEQLITAVTAFCPGVEAVEPGVCAFGARGPARYFGGETALAGRIIAAVADLGTQARVGVADGLFAAHLAARRADPARGRPVLVVPPGRTAEFLAGQPVSVLADQPGQDRGQGQGQDLVGLLTRLGLRTLGDLAALPASDVATRFGAAGETVHRLARGLGSRPLAVRPPAEDLSVAQEFDPPEPRAEPVVFAAKALAERMHAGLAARGLTCVRVEVRAACADGRESRRLWRHDGLLSATALADRVRWQLDGWRVPTDTTDDGITALHLVPDQVVHATGHQLALWGETVVSDRVARAAMRVQAILGHEAVLRPVLGGGRDVAERVNHVPFGEKRQPRLAVGPPWPGWIMGAAPGVVYPFAREADVTDEAGDAVTVTGRCVLSAVPVWLAADGGPPVRITGWAGPWPLSERWWDLAAARRRARFQLLTGDGRAWLAAVQDGRWLIEAGYWLWALTTRRCPGASCGGGWPGDPRTSPRTSPPPTRPTLTRPTLPRRAR
jgi:protein ImuB